MTSPRSLLPLLVLLALLALGAAAAGAASPIGGAAYRAHDHSVRGSGWHVDARIAKGGKAVEMLVLFAEKCGDNTVVAEDVPVGPDGAVSSSGPVEADEPEAGSYRMDARFATDRRLEGTFQVTTPAGCDTGPIAFVARTKTRSHDHEGGGQHSHHSYGHPMGTMPDLGDASPKALRQAERLWRATLSSAARRFPTIGAAMERGFIRSPRRFGRPVLFHLRRPAYDKDRHSLRPSRPESLVYYWPGRGEPVLIAFMYRKPVGRAPRYAAPLLAWHSHTHEGRRGKTQMTHVWLTNGLKSALANCLPVRYLENNLRRFRFRDVPTVGAAHESAPCPD